jgi:hypothetical protein
MGEGGGFDTFEGLYVSLNIKQAQLGKTLVNQGILQGLMID